MKTTLLLSTLAALAPINFAQEAPTAEAPVISAAPAAVTEQDLLDFIARMDQITDIFKSVTDKESADKAAPILLELAEKMHASTATLEALDEEVLMKHLATLMEAATKMGEVVDRLDEVNYYGSEALKAAAEAGPDDEEVETDEPEPQAS